MKVSLSYISFRKESWNIFARLRAFRHESAIVKTERCLYYATRVNKSFQDGSLGHERATVLLTRPITIQWAPSNFVKRDKTRRGGLRAVYFIIEFARRRAPEPGEQRSY